MRKTLILLLMTTVFALSANAGTNYTRPSSLQSIENGSIYSIYQDGLGALWMNTNYGICRYNGQSLEFVHDPLPMSTIIGNGKDRFYIPAVTCILQFNLDSSVPEKLTPQGRNISQSIYFAEQDTLWIGSKGSIYNFKACIIKL